MFRVMKDLQQIFFLPQTVVVRLIYATTDVVVKVDICLIY